MKNLILILVFAMSVLLSFIATADNTDKNTAPGSVAAVIDVDLQTVDSQTPVVDCDQVEVSIPGVDVTHNKCVSGLTFHCGAPYDYESSMTGTESESYSWYHPSDYGVRHTWTRAIWFN